MELRDSAMPDEPAVPGSRDAGSPPSAAAPPPVRAAGGRRPDAAGTSCAGWRVDGRLTGMKIAGTVIFAVAALVLHTDPLGVSLSALAAAALLVYLIRDLARPVRLMADAEGITVVAGFARRERLRWDQVQRVRVDRRRRLGTTAELLEIDTGDALHLFSSYDLGVPPHEAERTLAAVRARALSR